MTSILALSPLDGRYQNKCNELTDYFSEKALIHYRLHVEVEWLKSLAMSKAINELPSFDDKQMTFLEELVENFSVEQAEAVKAIEATTNHDVKAVEYFLKQQLEGQEGFAKALSFIHFGLTSEDVNNLAVNLMLQDGLTIVMVPQFDKLLGQLEEFVKTHQALPMMAKTHGQPATPTTVGKEFANVYHRVHHQLTGLEGIPLLSKCNGATGNYSALLAAYPDIDWPAHSQHFIESLGLDFNPYTTQIEPHDSLAEVFNGCMRLNTILIDFSRDVWSYISCGYFKQKAKDGEVGSSTMPHKVNPIDFENAEGNFGLSNAVFSHLSEKLPISRLQRDLSDSTVLRNIGSGFAYTMIALKSLEKGLGKVDIDAELIKQDLNQHWELLAEPVQTVMRRYGIDDAYEQLKAISRGKPLNKDSLHQFINQLTINDKAKASLLALTPENYIGLAQQLAEAL